MSGEVKPSDSSSPGELICKVCDKTLQKPRLLPCLHSVCTDCLKRILDTNKTADSIECPHCEESFDVSGYDVTDFPSNEYLITVIDVYFSKHNNDKQCDVCDLKSKKSPAKFRCVDCEDFLCDDCGNVHSSTRLTFDHQVLSLDELARGSHDDAIRENRKMHCLIHEKEVLDFYCKSCNCLVCRECRLNDHFDHGSIPVADVQELKRDKVTDVIQRLEIKIKALFDGDVEAENVIRELDHSEQTAIYEVENTSELLKERIENEKNELIETVKQHVANEKARCTQQKSDINTRHALLTYGTDFCSKAASESKDAEIIHLEPELSDRLRYLDKLPQPSTDIRCKMPEVKLRNLYGSIDSMKFFEFSPASPSTAPSILPPGVAESDIPKVSSLNLKKRINVFVSDDETSPKITGLCIVNNELIVSDYANRKIKILSLSGTHIKSISSTTALSIAAFDDVIGVSDHFAVTVVSRDNSMKHRIDLESTSGSYPLSVMSGNTFLVANSKHHVFMTFDKHGSPVEEYRMARSSKKSFSRAVTYVTTTSKGDFVVSDWGTNTVAVMGMDGKLKLEYNARPLSYTKDWQPGGVCVDIHDNIFLVDQRQGNVTVLNPTGKVIYRHNCKKDGLDRPLNIATDHNSYIYVTGKGGLIHVYLTEYL